MKKLAISIVTYNRAKHIREDLAAIAKPTKEQGIDIYIFDGSTNEKTRYVVEQYIAKGYDHIRYFHSDKQLSPVESIIQRCEGALHLPDAEYVWFCGDKFIIRPEHYAKIFSYMNKSYDIITIYGYILKGTVEFNRVSEFADYGIVPLTLWGANIIKKELIDSYSIRTEFKTAPSFSVQYIYLKAIAKCECFKGVVIDEKEQAAIESRYHSPSGSLSCMWMTWIQNWYYFIKNLPSAYDTVRENLYHKPDLQMGFFSFRELLRQRSEGQFDWMKCQEYRGYIKKIIVMPSFFVRCISLLPRNIAKWLWMNYSHGERVYCRVKNSVRLISEKLRGIQNNL